MGAVILAAVLLLPAFGCGDSCAYGNAKTIACSTLNACRRELGLPTTPHDGHLWPLFLVWDTSASGHWRCIQSGYVPEKYECRFSECAPDDPAL